MVHLIHRTSPINLNLGKPVMLSVPLNALERQLKFCPTRISGDPLWVAYKESYISEIQSDPESTYHLSTEFIIVCILHCYFYVIQYEPVQTGLNY